MIRPVDITYNVTYTGIQFNGANGGSPKHFHSSKQVHNMNINDYTDQRKKPGQRFWMPVAVLLVLPLLIAMPTRYAAGQEIYVPVSDSLALVAFYNSMSGEHWVNNGGWLVDRVDTWFGISTENIGTEQEPEWRVVEIDLSNNMTMPGTIPPEIGDLEYLADLVLRGEPALHGPWPDEIAKLQNIFEIRTQNTNMSGEIPWEKLAETSIQRIRLQDAQHRGEIPDGIFSQMTQLQRIEVSNQYLSGNFPSSVVDLVNLRRFRLQGNLLTGTIPDMGHIARVNQFHVNGNPLDPGPVWPWIESWAEELEEMRIDNTNRTGEFPSWLANNMFALEELTIGEISWDLENAIGGAFPDMSTLLELDELHIYGPHWEGSLPEWIGTKAMNRIFLFYCSFSGDIPASYAETREQVRIEHCPEITGGIPETFELFTGRDFVLRMSDSWDNKYDRLGEDAAAYFRNPQMQVGDIPSYVGNWSREVTLKNVGLTGTIPSALLDNQGLEFLDLSENPGLTGDLPAGIFNLPLSLFDISNTGLNVTEIPAGLLEWELTLNTLGMAGLNMGGSIPAAIGNFPLLQNLNMSDNNLTGSIPEEIGNLPLIISLNLANNQLSGELPASLQDIGYLAGFYTLNALDLSGNEGLSGEMPLRFAEANRMRVLRYKDTEIWAPEDGAFADWIDNVIPENTGLSFPSLYVDVQTSGLVGPPVTNTEIIGKPYVFQLTGNYPNPFNPSTSFTYQIPVEGHVTLSIYNVLGQRVAVLVNEVQNAGEYQVTFDAAPFASGTYLYRLESGGQTMTRTMMLIK